MTDTMQAVCFMGEGKVAVQEVPRPAIQEPGDALIRVTTSSICGSDIHLIHNEILCQEGDTLGHEFVGEIAALGDDVEGFEVGERVVVSCTVQCGECRFCRMGLYAKCVKGGVFGHGQMLGGLGGGQSEFVRVPHARFTLEKIPEGLSDEDVLFVGDILSTGFMAAEKGQVRPGDSVAVFGVGPVGLCAIASAKLFAPAHIIAVDPIEHRLEVAKALGATETINPAETDPVARIHEMTGAGPQLSLMPLAGVDVAIEAVGVAPTFDACLQAVRPGGHVSFVGVFTEEQTLPMPILCVKNITIHMGLVNMVNMGRLLGLIERGALDLTPLVTHTMALGDAAEAYEIFEGKRDKVLKIVLKP